MLWDARKKAKAERRSDNKGDCTMSTSFGITKYTPTLIDKSWIGDGGSAGIDKKWVGGGGGFWEYEV